MRLPRLHRAPATPAAAAYAEAAVAAGKTPWRLAHFCVVDLELSGLDPRHDEIISFAAVPIDAGRVIAGDTYYGTSKSTRPLEASSVLVHGIRTVDLADTPPLDEAIQPLLSAMTGRILVAHVAWVETSFLGRALDRQGIRLRTPVLDTYELARLLAFERNEPRPSHSLEEIAHGLKLPVHRQHHALGDALTTAQVFITLATHLETFGPETVETLAEAKARCALFAG